MQSQKKTDVAKDKKGLTVTIHVGGERVERLTAEQLHGISERLGNTMSRYYSNHSEEYRKIKEQTNVRN